MATVPDLSGNAPASLVVQGRAIDYALSTYNRIVAGNPNGSVLPLFVGEIVFDTTNNELYYALTANNDDWVITSLVK